MKMRTSLKRGLGLAAAGLLTLGMADQAQAQFTRAVALVGGDVLFEFDVTAPGTLFGPVLIDNNDFVGNGAGELLIGIDFRANGGALVGVSNQNRLYSINRTTGDLTQLSPGAAAFTPGIAGTAFGFDFNPTVDRIRQVSDATQNLRLNPNTGQVASVDGTLAYEGTDINAGATPSIVAAGYTNSYAGGPNPQVPTRTTALYYLDSDLNILATTGTGGANGGVIVTVGQTGFNFTDNSHLDITSNATGTVNIAYAALEVGGFTGLYSINLGTGLATPIGQIGNGGVLDDFAIVNAASDAPLPVELSSFSGSNVNGAVQLSWATATELDNAGFAVLRGGVEIASFRGTPALVGGGTTSQGRSYGYTDARVVAGQSYTYTLRSYDVSGTTHDYKLTATVEVNNGTGSANLPGEFRLHEAAPNPFNPTTSLQLDLPQSAVVTAVAYNALGQAVRTLVNGQTMSAGIQTVGFAADGLPSGMYVIRVTAVSNGRTAVQAQRVSLAK